MRAQLRIVRITARSANTSSASEQGRPWLERPKGKRTATIHTDDHDIAELQRDEWLSNSRAGVTACHAAISSARGKGLKEFSTRQCVVSSMEPNGEATNRDKAWSRLARMESLIRQARRHNLDTWGARRGMAGDYMMPQPSRSGRAEDGRVRTEIGSSSGGARCIRPIQKGAAADLSSCLVYWNLSCWTVALRIVPGGAWQHYSRVFLQYSGTRRSRNPCASSARRMRSVQFIQCPCGRSVYAEECISTRNSDAPPECWPELPRINQTSNLDGLPRLQGPHCS